MSAAQDTGRPARLDSSQGCSARPAPSWPAIDLHLQSRAAELLMQACRGEARQHGPGCWGGPWKQVAFVSASCPHPSSPFAGLSVSASPCASPTQLRAHLYRASHRCASRRASSTSRSYSLRAMGQPRSCKIVRGGEEVPPRPHNKPKAGELRTSLTRLGWTQRARWQWHTGASLLRWQLRCARSSATLHAAALRRRPGQSRMIGVQPGAARGRGSRSCGCCAVQGRRSATWHLCRQSA